MKKSADGRPKMVRRFCLAALAIAVFFAGPGCRSKTKIPGQLYVLAQSTIYAVSQDSARMLVSEVSAAAVSPDGHFLLFAQKGQTILQDLGTGVDKTILSESGRAMGWNADGSRFFVVTGCETNRLYAGTPAGNPTKIYQGTKSVRRAAEDGSPAEELICGELGDCLFLDKNRLVFSAYEGPLRNGTDGGDIYANKAYLVRLDITPAQLEAVEFPANERWKFMDVCEENDEVLLSVEQNPENASKFKSTDYVSPRFEEWGQISFQNEIRQKISRWPTGSWGMAGEAALLFLPQTHFLFGVANESTEKGVRNYFVQIDPDTGQEAQGPDTGAGEIINRPVFDPEERFAAILYNQGTQEHITVMDLQTNARFKIWRIKAPKGYSFEATQDRLLAWIQ